MHFNKQTIAQHNTVFSISELCGPNVHKMSQTKTEIYPISLSDKPRFLPVSERISNNKALATVQRVPMTMTHVTNTG